MTYEQFAAEMSALISKMLAYKINEIGHRIYAEKCAALEDAHPEFAARFDDEI